jgi:hypothetical protein
MRNRPGSIEGRLQRLADELVDEGFATSDRSWPRVLLEELDYARHPAVFERRVPSYGAIVAPAVDTAGWSGPTQLTITSRSVDGIPLTDSRRFADGLSSWLVHPVEGPRILSVFDRAAGSERDLVVLAAATGATVVQRHPAGVVRAAGEFGVIRWDGLAWHHEPPIRSWIDSVGVCSPAGDRDLLEAVLEFAVHDLGARGIGALLVLDPRTGEGDDNGRELRLAPPPPLRIDRPADLAPLRHALTQTDGAAVLDGDGTLRELGVRLVPSPEAEADVEGFRGMRHTSARRYSFDDPKATVIVVSEDGPVTVLRNGLLLGRSDPT